MNDQDILTEVATALYYELNRQNPVPISGTIDCEALAQVSIAAYLDIQRRLVAEAMERHQKKRGQHHAEDNDLAAGS